MQRSSPSWTPSRHPKSRMQTVERLVGVYGVLKPCLLASYEDHLAHANAVYEPPTQRILARCAEDERRHIAAGRSSSAISRPRPA